MPSKKNGYYEACEKLAAGLEGISSLAEDAQPYLKDVKNEALNDTIKLAEKYCLDNGLGAPDGSPIKGEAAKLLMDKFDEAVNDSDFKFINKLKDLGFIHK